MSNINQTYIPSWTIRQVQDTILPTDKAQTTNSVIHWHCNDWGHDEYVDVKVTHGGALKTESEVVNSSWNVINPSSEERQVDLQNLTEALYELVSRLEFLPSIRWVSADIRVTPTATPNMATLTTLSNLAAIWWYSSNNHIPWVMNNIAVISNINNISI